MKPKDLGFGEPCELCIEEFCESLPRCSGFDPILLSDRERLQSVPDKGVSNEGLIYAFLCHACGCRWQVLDWQICGCVVVRQQSPDGEYSATGHYVDGKKDGDFSYHWDWQGDKYVGALVLGERWDHGRLVHRNEYGRVVAKVTGQVSMDVIRRWRAPKKKGPGKTGRTTPPTSRPARRKRPGSEGRTTG